MKYKIFFLGIFFIILVNLAGIEDVDYQSLFIILCCSLLLLRLVLKLNLILKYNINLGRVLLYFLWLIKEIVLSSIQIVKIVCKKNLSLSPSIGFVLSGIGSDFGNILYANSITLTPGTITISLDSKQQVFKVHALDKGLIDDLQQGAMLNKIYRVIQ